MNPDDLNTVGSIVYTGNGVSMVGNGGTIVPINATASAQVTTSNWFDVDDLLDQHIMNRITLDHKLQEQELMKLRETVPTYADEIKENLSKNAARDIIKKMTFTKKHDKDTDVHHFIGRVWVFTEDELKNLINEVRNA